MLFLWKGLGPFRFSKLLKHGKIASGGCCTSCQCSGIFAIIINIASIRDR